MRKIIISLFKRIFRCFSKPYIVFESVPDFSDNAISVCDELKKRGYDKKYTFAWYIGDGTLAYDTNYLKTRWIKDKSSLKSLISGVKYYFCVKAVIICNRVFYSDNADLSIYLTHGTPIKHTRDYYTIPNEIDYCIAPSEDAREIISYEFNYDYNRIIPLGYPRNDAFSEPPIKLNEVFVEDYDKYIIWYPTFRQHKIGISTGSKETIPLITDAEAANKLNDCAKQNNVLIIIKPHFAQDISRIKALTLSNIQFINDDFFNEHAISSYQLLNSCDALLSDYSSVVFDYLLAEKPIGLIWTDIEDYKTIPGLYPDYEELTIGTHKIYSVEEFEQFIDMVSNGVDFLEEQRNKLRDLLNISTDGKNAERVVDFIVEKAKL